MILGAVTANEPFPQIFTSDYWLQDALKNLLVWIFGSSNPNIVNSCLPLCRCVILNEPVTQIIITKEGDRNLLVLPTCVFVPKLLPDWKKKCYAPCISVMSTNLFRRLLLIRNDFSVHCKFQVTSPTMEFMIIVKYLNSLIYDNDQ